MKEQLHKRFTDEQLKSLLKEYINRGLQINYTLDILGIEPARFFGLAKKYASFYDTNLQEGIDKPF